MLWRDLDFLLRDAVHRIYSTIMIRDETKGRNFDPEDSTWDPFPKNEVRHVVKDVRVSKHSCVQRFKG